MYLKQRIDIQCIILNNVDKKVLTSESHGRSKNLKGKNVSWTNISYCDRRHQSGNFPSEILFNF